MDEDFFDWLMVNQVFESLDMEPGAFVFRPVIILIITGAVVTSTIPKTMSSR